MCKILGDCVRNIPIKVYTDSKNLHKAANSSALVEDSKLRLDLAMLKESIGMKEIDELVHVDRKKMLADCLTKKEVQGWGSFFNKAMYICIYSNSQCQV